MSEKETLSFLKSSQNFALRARKFRSAARPCVPGRKREVSPAYALHGLVGLGLALRWYLLCSRTTCHCRSQLAQVVRSSHSFVPTRHLPLRVGCALMDLAQKPSVGHWASALFHRGPGERSAICSSSVDVHCSAALRRPTGFPKYLECFGLRDLPIKSGRSLF